MPPDPAAVRCGVLLVGSELLDGRVRDLNLGILARILYGEGIVVVEGRTVPDSSEDVARALLDLSSRHGLVVSTGGLGSTCDDVTVEAAAAALGLPWRRTERRRR